jgi:hypothetical protein
MASHWRITVDAAKFNTAKDVGPIVNVDRKSMNTNSIEEISILQAMGDTTISSLEEQLEKTQNSIDNLVLPSLDPSCPSNDTSMSPTIVAQSLGTLPGIRTRHNQ